MLLLSLSATSAAAGSRDRDHGPSVARQWDEELLDAIRIDIPKPPVHARNLFHLSVAMWDAWAAYSPTAVGYLVREKHKAADVEAARDEAISFAAYRLLKYRFPVGYFDGNGNPCHPNDATSQAAFDARMDALGYDRTFTSTVGDTPAALGNRIAAAGSGGRGCGGREGRDGGADRAEQPHRPLTEHPHRCPAGGHFQHLAGRGRRHGPPDDPRHERTVRARRRQSRRLPARRHRVL